MRDPRLLATGVLLSGALLLATVLNPADPPVLPGDPAGVTAESDYSKLPLAFEPNAGRMTQDIDFVAHTGAGAAYLSDTGARLVLSGGEEKALELGLIGSSPSKPATSGELPGTVNDLRGDDADKWETGIPTFQTVRYPGVYPGVALDWHGNAEGRLEYDFMLAPGADPERIALGVSGADHLRLAGNGDLLIGVGDRTLRQEAPRAFSQPAVAGGALTPVDARFELRGETVGFHVGRHDPTKGLLIDPVVLDYSTYLGGNGADEANGIAVDDDGSAYITGRTLSSDFATAGGVEGDEPHADAFITKLNPAGDAVEYSTYLGGARDDRGNAIAVGPGGTAYIAGTTASKDFNTVNALREDRDGFSANAFFAKLNPAGDGLEYSTYFGEQFGQNPDNIGGNASEGIAVAVDAAGNAYLAGNTDDRIPTTDNRLQNEMTEPEPKPSTGSTANTALIADGFVYKLDPSQSGEASLLYGTYLGGDRGDSVNGIAVDSAGAMYVTGATASSDFLTEGPYEEHNGHFDAFVSKIAPDGGSLEYSTYLGGTDYDAAHAIAIDDSGAAYVTGMTQSEDFDTTAGAEGDSAGPDAFAAKLSPGGDELGYSTYLGGTYADAANGIAVDDGGSAHLTGETTSIDFPRAGALEDDSAGADAFVSSLDADGKLSCSTYLGGNGVDAGNAIAVGGGGAAHVAGATQSANFATKGQIESDSAGSDAFASKLDLSGPCERADEPAVTTSVDDLRVFVVVLDGLRPQEINPFLTPNLNLLKEDSTWYEQARSVFIAETLPNHAAMMTGALPRRNGITGNAYWHDAPGNGQFLSKYTLADARLLGAETLTSTLENNCEVSTATVQSKYYLHQLFGGEAPTPPDPFNQRRADYHWNPVTSGAYITKPDEHTPDQFVMDEGFLPWFHSDAPTPQFAFLNLGDVDRSGHVDESGATTMGMVSGFRQGVLTDTDRLVGAWIDELKASGGWEDSVVIFTSDHGMDWSIPANVEIMDPGTSPTGIPAARKIVINGGAAMLYLNDGADIAATAQSLLARRGIEFVATRTPVGNQPTLEDMGIDHQHTGDIVAFAKPGFRIALSGPDSNPIPGNHGHAVTQHQTLFVTGGHPALADRPQSIGGPEVYDPSHWRFAPPTEGPGNLSIAPTVAALFGLPDPPGGYDGDPLSDAFDPGALPASTPCRLHRQVETTPPGPDPGGDDDGTPKGNGPAAAPHAKKGCKRFKSKAKRRKCARKKRGVAR